MSTIRHFSLSLIFGTCISAASIASALPVGAISFSQDQVFQTRSNGRTVTCATVSGRWIPGKLVGTARDRFLSHAQAIKNLKASLRTASEAKKAKIRLKIASTKALNAAQTPLCRNGPNSNPGSTPTPQPTAVTTNFDSAGNVTSKGRTTFAIPTNLNGNITTGKNIHSQYACTSCHSEKTGKSYTQIKAAINSVSAMMFFQDQSSDQDIAHITAYLNRFRM